MSKRGVPKKVLVARLNRDRWDERSDKGNLVQEISKVEKSKNTHHDQDHPIGTGARTTQHSLVLLLSIL